MTPLTTWTIPADVFTSALTTLTPLTVTSVEYVFLYTLTLTGAPVAVATLWSAFRSVDLISAFGMTWYKRVFFNKLGSLVSACATAGSARSLSKAALVGAKIVAGATLNKVSTRSALTTKSSNVVSPACLSSSAISPKTI